MMERVTSITGKTFSIEPRKHCSIKDAPSASARKGYGSSVMPQDLLDKYSKPSPRIQRKAAILAIRDEVNGLDDGEPDVYGMLKGDYPVGRKGRYGRIS